MTLKERLASELEQHGLWPDEANTVMDTVAQVPGEMQTRWGDDENGYPPHILRVLWLPVKDAAIKYLEENKPKHFALSVLRA